LSVPIDKDATITLVARAGDRSSEAANLRVIWKRYARLGGDRPKAEALCARGRH
jgi:hypothetical protein